MPERGEAESSGARADLHMHSTRSDGVHEPEELVEMAANAGLGTIALTDHDTIAGWRTFSDASAARGIGAICGVELSGRMGTRDAHVLGYFVDPDDGPLQRALHAFVELRTERAERIVRKLNDVGVPLEMEAVERAAGGGVVGRPHVAEALVASGFVKHQQEAFKRYIGIGRPGYAEKSAFEAERAIELIHEAGGLAVLAHPNGHYDESDVAFLAASGLDGVEVIHPRHAPGDTRRFEEIAERHGLFVTGGSDFHGGARGAAKVGDPSVPLSWVTTMRQARKERNGE